MIRDLSSDSIIQVARVAVVVILISAIANIVFPFAVGIPVGGAADPEQLPAWYRSISLAISCVRYGAYVVAGIVYVALAKHNRLLPNIVGGTAAAGLPALADVVISAVNTALTIDNYNAVATTPTSPMAAAIVGGLAVFIVATFLGALGGLMAGVVRMQRGGGPNT